MSDTTMSMAEMVQRKAELDALLRQVTSETAMLSKGIREANAAVSTASISTLSKTSVRYGIGTETMVIAAVLKVTDTIQAKGKRLWRISSALTSAREPRRPISERLTSPRLTESTL